MSRRRAARAHRDLGRPRRRRDRRLPRRRRLRGPARRRSQMTPQELIDLVKASGLRGRGGAGFPTGREVVVRPAGHGQADLRGLQLRRVRARDLQQPRARRARPAPAARGDRDRGATRSGARTRSSTPAASSCWQATRARARDRARRTTKGFVGENILGSGMRRRRSPCSPRRRRVHLRRGDGAAQLPRGLARAAAPAPAVPGGRRALRVPDRRSTTSRRCATCPTIVTNGAPSGSRAIGTEKSPGTKLFSVSGKVERPGQLRGPDGHAVPRRCSRTARGRARRASG